MKRIIPFILLLLLPTFLGLKHEPPEDQMAKTYFGLSITNSYQSGIITYALIKVHQGNIVSKKFLRRDVFVQMIVGRIPSAANLDGKNLFIENGLDTCVVYVDDIQGHYTSHICDPLDQLWKIKYREHPIQHGLEEGWSQGFYAPSMPQLQFLKKEFGVWNTNQFFWGPTMWDLLNKVMDRQWTQQYKNAE